MRLGCTPILPLFRSASEVAVVGDLGFVLRFELGFTVFFATAFLLTLFDLETDFDVFALGLAVADRGFARLFGDAAALAG